jgi:hypothetical protein
MMDEIVEEQKSIVVRLEQPFGQIATDVLEFTIVRVITGLDET